MNVLLSLDSVSRFHCRCGLDKFGYFISVSNDGCHCLKYYNWDFCSHNFYVYSNVQISLKFFPHYFWVTFFSFFQSRVSFIRLDNHQLFSDISVICVFKKLPVAKILKPHFCFLSFTVKYIIYGRKCLGPQLA